MLIYIGIIIFSVIIHEMGHLLTALAFKVKVNAFSIGFGKVLLHKKWKGIDWRISLLPFGGYCDIDEAIDKENTLSTIAYWKQVIILISGVSLNFLLALICYWLQGLTIVQGIYIDILTFKCLITNRLYMLYAMVDYLDLNTFLLQTSILNLGLAITNLIPLPALDGGYLWMLPLRKKMGERLFKIIIFTSFTLLIILQFVIIYFWWLK